MQQANNITAIILAGGKSTRMKTDKGLVLFKSKPLIQHVIDAISPLTPSIIIITSNPAYEKFGYPCFADEIHHKGPLAGIFTGLTHSSTQKNILLGCDMPFLTTTLLEALISDCGNEDVLLTEHQGKAEPLCSIYDLHCIPHLRKCLEENHLKITDALQGLHTRVISFDEAGWFRGNEFANMNTPDSLTGSETI